MFLAIVLIKSAFCKSYDISFFCISTRIISPRLGGSIWPALTKTTSRCCSIIASTYLGSAFNAKSHGSGINICGEFSPRRRTLNLNIGELIATESGFTATPRPEPFRTEFSNNSIAEPGVSKILQSKNSLAIRRISLNNIIKIRLVVFR